MFSLQGLGDIAYIAVKAAKRSIGSTVHNKYLQFYHLVSWPSMYSLVLQDGSQTIRTIAVILL